MHGSQVSVVSSKDSLHFKQSQVIPLVSIQGVSVRFEQELHWWLFNSWNWLHWMQLQVCGENSEQLKTISSHDLQRV